MMDVDVLISDFSEFGAQRVAITAANGLHERGYRVRFVVLRAEGPFRDSLNAHIPCVELLGRETWQPPRRTQLSTAAVRYRRLCGDGRDRTVISFSPVTNALALVATTGQKRQRCIVQEHAFQSIAIRDSSSYSPQFRVLYRVLAPSYRFADQLVCVSDALRADICQTYGVPPRKTITIYNPVDSELLQRRAAEPSRVWSTGSEFKIIAVGRLAPQKNFRRFLEVVKRMTQLAPDLNFEAVILGDGPDKERLLIQREALGLQGRVSLPGFTANPYPAIKEADVLCLTSEREGLPMVIAEAMALGTVVVAHDCPSGPREMIDKNSGVLVPYGDLNALARGLIGLTDPDTRLRMSMAGKLRADQLFSKQVFLDQYEVMLRSLS